MGEHSPTPWEVVPDPQDESGYNPNGEMPFVIQCAASWNIAVIVGDVPDLPAEANAEFIVRACNAHDDLVAALRSARAQLQNYENVISSESYNDTQINAALAKAEAQQ